MEIRLIKILVTIKVINSFCNKNVTLSIWELNLYIFLCENYFIRRGYPSTSLSLNNVYGYSSLEYYHPNFFTRQFQSFTQMSNNLSHIDFQQQSISEENEIRYASHHDCTNHSEQNNDFHNVSLRNFDSNFEELRIIVVSQVKLITFIYVKELISF